MTRVYISENTYRLISFFFGGGGEKGEEKKGENMKEKDRKRELLFRGKLKLKWENKYK
jgi:hypothetical protein